MAEQRCGKSADASADRKGPAKADTTAEQSEVAELSVRVGGSPEGGVLSFEALLNSPLLTLAWYSVLLPSQETYSQVLTRGNTG